MSSPAQWAGRGGGGARSGRSLGPTLVEGRTVTGQAGEKTGVAHQGIGHLLRLARPVMAWEAGLSASARRSQAQ